MPLDACCAGDSGILIALRQEFSVKFGLVGNRKSLGVRETRTKHVKLVGERVLENQE